jgi:hypothetical protein
LNAIKKAYLPAALAVMPEAVGTARAGRQVDKGLIERWFARDRGYVRAVAPGIPPDVVTCGEERVRREYCFFTQINPFLPYNR